MAEENTNSKTLIIEYASIAIALQNAMFTE
jgi:hypothetical protein